MGNPLSNAAIGFRLWGVLCKESSEDLTCFCTPKRHLGTGLTPVAHNAVYTYLQSSPLRKRHSRDGTGWSSRDNLVGRLTRLLGAELEEAAKAVRACVMPQLAQCLGFDLTD